MQVKLCQQDVSAACKPLQARTQPQPAAPGPRPPSPSHSNKNALDCSGGAVAAAACVNSAASAPHFHWETLLGMVSRVLLR